MSSFSEIFNYHIVPPVFVVFFTIISQFMASFGNPEKSFKFDFLFGNCFAWKCVGLFILWALIFLWIPGKTFYGPKTAFNLTPKYKANGELYFFSSILTYLLLEFTIFPGLSLEIYKNFGFILGVCNIVALTLCLFLLIKGKSIKNPEDPYLRERKYPIFHELYRGMELHPRILGVDVKQFTNCRFGMMSFELLLIIYLIASYNMNGFNWGLFVNVLLQTVYIFKFFHWETGYFNTLDITLDRAGYYLAWGCLVWIPAFFTFPTYYFVYHQPSISPGNSIFLLIVGLLSIYLTYAVDEQKELFRETKGKCKIWDKPANYIKVNYKTADGELKESQLLTSGWWGIARKANYSFELLTGLSWSLIAGMDSIWPYTYITFLTILIIHRIYRDEEKCKSKYGKGWDEYCKKVNYRLVPFLY